MKNMYYELSRKKYDKNGQLELKLAYKIEQINI